MNKWLLIILESFLSISIFAQSFSLFRVKPTSFREISNVSRVLEKRAQTTFLRAKEIQLQNPTANRFLFYSFPLNSVRMFSTSSTPQVLIYPRATFLQKNKQFWHYFIARNNRLLAKQYPQAIQAQQAIRDNIPNFANALASMPIPLNSTSQEQWLIDNLPADIQYLLIGEMHGYPEVQKSVEELLFNLREKYPQKEIILFSEFLESPLVWQENHISSREKGSRYENVWNVAEENNMLVVGLEPEFTNKVEETLKGKKINEKGGTTYSERNVWASLEGVRLRNEQWELLLTQYRNEHPNALFVLHTGAAHTQYNMPFSLGKDFFPPEVTFMVNVYPIYLLHDDTNLISNFDEETDGKFADIPTILWKDKNLAKIAGFDAQIKVEVFPHEE